MVIRIVLALLAAVLCYMVARLVFNEAVAAIIALLVAIAVLLHPTPVG